ncbi:unnamed protein product [Lymnaea stagnalis]|uniref:Coiled-coil domain-containing protein R3HCC1L n=1 Tax=Lymnaea stagnalis TaxID=6523 RepID=A0AAV2HQS8_LYMST
MSTPPQSRGRGRGRGKDLTPSERVAQWVNQREAKRLTKERWGSQSTRSTSPSVESEIDGQISDKLTPDSDSSSERSKVKPKIQIYVPPFLRDKKPVNVDIPSETTSHTDEGILYQTSNDMGSPITDDSHCGDDVLLAQEAELSSPKDVIICTVDKPEKPFERNRSKGRGKRKPEVEIYIPRALRSAKQDNKLSIEKCHDYNLYQDAVLELENRNVDTQITSLSEPQTNSEVPEMSVSNSVIFNTNNLFSNKITSEISDSAFIIETGNLLADQLSNSEIAYSNPVILDAGILLPNQISTSEISDSNPEILDPGISNQFTSDTEKSALQVVLPEFLPSQAGDNLDHGCLLRQDAPVMSDGGEVKNNIESNCEVLVGKISPFTFEFYDPAVIAFLPSPPIRPLGEADVVPYFSGTSRSVSLNDELLMQEQFIDSSPVSNDKIAPLPEEGATGSSEKCYRCDSQRISGEICISLDKFKHDESENSYDNQVTDKVSHTNETGNISSSNSDVKVNNNVTDVEASSPSSEKLKSKKHKTKKKTKESSTSKSKESKSKSKKESVKKKDAQDANAEKIKKGIKEQISAEETVDSWDALYDENGDCLDDSMLQELTEYVGKVEIDKPKINYLKYEPKEPSLDFQAFSHIVEIFEFPPEFSTADLIGAFRDFASRGFDVKWVDDTHALGVFSSTVAANEALKMIHPLLKVRPMSEASKKGQAKARVCQEFLQPYKARPETTSLAARRLVAGALGMAPRVSREVRDQERQKLKEAKEKRRQERQQKNDAWDGAMGKCATEELDLGFS